MDILNRNPIEVLYAFWLQKQMSYKKEGNIVDMRFPEYSDEKVKMLRDSLINRLRILQERFEEISNNTSLDSIKKARELRMLNETIINTSQHLISSFPPIKEYDREMVDDKPLKDVMFATALSQLLPSESLSDVYKYASELLLKEVKDKQKKGEQNVHTQ